MNRKQLHADILIVDDTPANLQLLVKMLQEQGYEVRPANSGKLALRVAKLAPPDLILLDINMPEMNGYEVCRQLKLDKDLKDVPIIFISALDDTSDKVQAFKEGGVDFVTKPFHLEEVLARIKTHLTIYFQKKEIEELHRQERAYFEAITQLKDDVLQSVSHDLKNPLTGMLLATNMLKENLVDHPNPIVLDLLTKLERGVDQMTGLITDLLDLAQLETRQSLNFNPISLNEYLTDIYEAFQLPAKQKDITLSFFPSSPDVIFVVDIPQMRRAINNLMSNALKYTSKEGQVSISAQASPENITIQVKDTGLGIPDSDLPYIFDKFYRINTESHMEQEGTGLGLSIVKTIVDKHGGEIAVKSQLGQGTTFTITLPK